MTKMEQDDDVDDSYIMLVCLEHGTWNMRHEKFPDAFRIQGIFSFLLFLDTFSLISKPKSAQKWEKMK